MSPTGEPDLDPVRVAATAPDHGDPPTAPGDEAPEPGDRARVRAGRVAARYEQTRRRFEHTRHRLEGTAAGHVTRRAIEVDVVHQALVFAALGFLLVVPILISLSALVPLGADGGVATVFAHRVGLTDEATRDLQQLFSAQATVRTGATWGGVLLSVVCAISWPLTLQKGYEIAWGLPRSGLRELWRPVAWMVSVFALVVIAALGGTVSSVPGRVTLVVLGVPALVAWSWWTQHLLLAGRIPWRSLLPGAVAIALGLVGLKVLAGLLLSTSIVVNHDEYGPIGVVFMMLSWLIALSVVFLGGALLGATLIARSEGRPVDEPGTPTPTVDEDT